MKKFLFFILFLFLGYDYIFAISPLVYSTYIGGSNSEVSNSIIIDTNGNALITGTTTSSNYPTTSGVYEVSY